MSDRVTMPVDPVEDTVEVKQKRILESGVVLGKHNHHIRMAVEKTVTTGIPLIRADKGVEFLEAFLLNYQIVDLLGILPSAVLVEFDVQGPNPRAFTWGQLTLLTKEFPSSGLPPAVYIHFVTRTFKATYWLQSHRLKLEWRRGTIGLFEIDKLSLSDAEPRLIELHYGGW